MNAHDDFKREVKETARALSEKDNIAVIHHYDADGMAAAGIIGKALEREGKKSSFKAIKQLYSETLEEIRGLGSFYVFADFGSSYLEEIKKAFKEEFVVIDHHQPKTSEREPRHLNPLLYGIDGSREISGAGLCFLVSEELNKKNQDLSALAIVGAVGDMQDSRGKLAGLNTEILEKGIKRGVLEKKQDLRFYGRISRPLTQFLEFATTPVLPELTANRENCTAFLQEQGIKLKEAGQWRSYEDLSLEEKKTLSTALILHLSKHGEPEWKIKSMFGEVYTLLKEDRKSPLRDAKEYATLLNATGRHGKAEIGLKVCLGDRNEYYQKAKKLLLEHRRKLREGIELMKKEGVQEREAYYYFDAGSHIQDSLVGIVAGMLYGSGTINSTKPIIALARHEDGSIKVSARGTSELVKKGLNLGKALKESCAELSEKSEGGGHTIAAGARIQEKEREKFLSILEKKIKKQGKYT